MKNLMLSLLLMFAVLGCKKTTEGETKAWHANQVEIERLQAKYPSFKSALDNLLTAAKADFDAAGKDAEKMAAANDRVAEAKGLFASYEKQSEKLKALVADTAWFDTVPAGLPPKLNDTARDAEKAAGEALAATPANIGEAKVKVEAATKAVSSAVTLLEGLKVPVVEYNKESDRVRKLLEDSFFGTLPAATVNPALDAAKAAQKSAFDNLAAIVNTEETKAKIEAETKSLSAAAAKLEALKPAPPAAKPEEGSAADSAAAGSAAP